MDEMEETVYLSSAPLRLDSESDERKVGMEQSLSQDVQDEADKTM
jgi:hypothetical protein